MTRPRVDLPGMRFSYDEKLADRIIDVYGHVNSNKSENEQSQLELHRRHLLGGAVKINVDLLPELSNAFEQSLETLGIDRTAGDMYVQQSPEYNAHVLAEDGRFDIVLNSALLRDFVLPELRFVIGHELGHVLYKHHEISIKRTLDDNRDMALEDVMMLFKWSRTAEISADRVGLLCASSLKASISALFKLSSGLSGISTSAIFKSLQSQYEDLAAHIESVDAQPSFVRTHPMTPIRFKALELATQHFKATYGRGATRSDVAFVELDAHLTHLFDNLEADAAPTSGFHTGEGQRYMCELLLFIALANGFLKPQHARLIEQLVNALGPKFPLVPLLDTATSAWRQFRYNIGQRLRSTTADTPLDEEELVRVVALATLMVSEGVPGETAVVFKIAIRDTCEALELPGLYLPEVRSLNHFTDNELLEILGVPVSKLKDSE